MKGQWRQDDFFWAVLVVVEGLIGVALVLGLTWLVMNYGESIRWR